MVSYQELKPCPFCQQPLKVVDGDMVHPFSWCILSGVSFPVENATTWNARTPDQMPEELAGALDKACKSVCELIGFSRGVDGLHLNGDVATWEELRTGGRFEGWLVEFDNALQVLRKYKAKVQP